MEGGIVVLEFIISVSFWGLLSVLCAVAILAQALKRHSTSSPQLKLLLPPTPATTRGPSALYIYITALPPFGLGPHPIRNNSNLNKFNDICSDLIA